MTTAIGLPTKPCSACGQPMIWVQHVRTHRRSPLNAEASPGGNCRVYPAGATFDVLTGDELAEARAAGEALFLNHFAACVHAADFRNREKGK